LRPLKRPIYAKASIDSEASLPPEAPLKIDAIAPSGNALHFDRLSAVSKVEPSAAAEASTELSRTSGAVLKPNLFVSTSAASLALPSVAP